MKSSRRSPRKHSRKSVKRRSSRKGSRRSKRRSSRKGSRRSKRRSPRKGSRRSKRRSPRKGSRRSRKGSKRSRKESRIVSKIYNVVKKYANKNIYNNETVLKVIKDEYEKAKNKKSLKYLSEDIADSLIMLYGSGIFSNITEKQVDEFHNKIKKIIL